MIQDEKTTPEEQHSAPKEAHAEKIQTIRENESPNASREKSKPGEPLSRYEMGQLALAIIGAILAGFGLWILNRQTEVMDKQNRIMDAQTALMNRQLTETRKATEQAGTQGLESLKASAAQSRAALNQSIEASRIDQRAWLGVKEVRLVGEISLEKGVKVVIKIENTGKTPARSVRVYNGIYRTLPEDCGLSSALSAGGEFVIPPNTAFDSSVAMAPQPATVLNSFKEGTASFYAVGVIKYEVVPLIVGIRNPPIFHHAAA